MHKEAKELLAFMKAIEANPRDVETRWIFADWLEEHDEPEEAVAHRNFSLEKYDAEKYLRHFCEKFGADYDDLLQNLARGEGYCFGDDDGPYAASDEEFWENVQILIEKEVNKDQSFRCSC